MTMKTILLSALCFVSMAETQSHGGQGMLGKHHKHKHHKRHNPGDDGQILLVNAKAPAPVKSDGNALLTHADTMVDAKKGQNMLQSQAVDKKTRLPGPGIDGDVLLTKADTMLKTKKGHNMLEPKSGDAPILDLPGPGDDGQILFDNYDPNKHMGKGHNMLAAKPGDTPAMPLPGPGDDGDILFKDYDPNKHVIKFGKGTNMLQSPAGQSMSVPKGTTLWTNDHTDVTAKVEGAIAHSNQIEGLSHKQRVQIDASMSKLRKAVDAVPQSDKVAG